MKYMASLIVVQDMARTKRFYMDLLGCRITQDFGANVTFDEGFSVQTAESWADFLEIAPDALRYGGRDAELYFEEKNFDGFLTRLAAWPEIACVHPVKTHTWGQRSVRFWDPDKHIVEVGEDMSAVCRRFHAQGMTAAQVARRMDVPVAYVEQCLSAAQD